MRWLLDFSDATLGLDLLGGVLVDVFYESVYGWFFGIYWSTGTMSGRVCSLLGLKKVCGFSVGLSYGLWRKAM